MGEDEEGLREPHDGELTRRQLRQKRKRQSWCDEPYWD